MKYVEIFQDNLRKSPLAVYRAMTQSYVAIPAATEPMVISSSSWQKLAEDAELVFSSMLKVIGWLRLSKQRAYAEDIFAELSTIEKAVIFGKKEPCANLSTLRYDLFFAEDELKILEVNTTIPAMQAYSDMVKKAYLSGITQGEGGWGARDHKECSEYRGIASDTSGMTQGRHRQPEPPDHNNCSQTYWNLDQSNTRDLLTSLLAHYTRLGGKKDKPRIAIVARQHDSQLAELLWYQTRWSELGFETVLVTPDQITLEGNNIIANEVPVDFTYRHIFASRLDPQSSFAHACMHSEKYFVFNPISAHLEIKAVLSEVARFADEGFLGFEKAPLLSSAEQEAVRRRVPWTRVITSGSAIVLGDEKTTDLVSWIKQNSNQLVIKKSAGYGGGGVIIGSDAPLKASQILQLSNNKASTWEGFVDYCAADRGQWIVQERISGKKMTQTVLTAEGTLQKADYYVDCSLYANYGVSYKLQGGVSRFSPERIVNIAQGGGLVPFFISI